MKVGKLTTRANKRQFAKKAGHVKGKNIFNPHKLHKGGEIIR